MENRHLVKRFTWGPPDAHGLAGERESREALAWLGRRLAFEQWLEGVRTVGTDTGAAAEAISA